MADSSSTQTQDRAKTDTGTDPATGYDASYSDQSSGAWQAPQEVFDSLFSSIVGPQQQHFTQQIADAYFQQAEHSIHMARRIADMQALSMIQGTIVQQCVGLVSQHLMRNPQFLISALRQSGWTVSPASSGPSSR